MSFVKISVHAVWGTKNRTPLLNNETRRLLCEHIKENARVKNFYIDSIDGYTDHLHCLMGLNADMSIAKQMQLIKGESAFWINKSGLLNFKFEWADEYFAASVSENDLDNVRNYIRGQEAHHQKLSFSEECQLFLKRSGFNINQG